MVLQQNTAQFSGSRIAFLHARPHFTQNRALSLFKSVPWLTLRCIRAAKGIPLRNSGVTRVNNQSVFCPQFPSAAAPPRPVVLSPLQKRFLLPRRLCKFRFLRGGDFHTKKKPDCPSSSTTFSMSKTRQHPLLVFLLHMTQSILLRQISYLKTTASNVVSTLPDLLFGCSTCFSSLRIRRSARYESSGVCTLASWEFSLGRTYAQFRLRPPLQKK